MIRRLFAIAVSAISVTLVASCASISVNSLPQIGGGGDDGYPVTIEFASVLNLPDRAKVVQDGKTVGVVTSIDLKADHVDVVSRIDSDVVIPADARATLQQSTVLGDTYVALADASDQAAPLSGSVAVAPGGRIPMANTTSPPQLEDTIANLANFVGSGSIQRIQNSIIGVNRVTPARRDELRRMVSRVTVDLADLSNNIDVVDKLLNGASGTAEVMNRNLSTYAYWFSPAGMTGFDRATQAAGYIGTVLPSIGSIYSGGYWLVPMLNSLADAVGAVQQTKWDVEAETPRWRDLFLNDFLPVDKYPAINITSITGPDGRELVGNVEDVLRILGATP
ncbi:MlaD family protein [Mycobacterium sp. shizuoka-1]|uniref:MlaD family protein n=1 Tax=Mycobacterium sp. shizuoka-1 TaxID=2039281 RepID=UPI000C0626C5|nr:MlaD family protein [Mycobacterium sp. shizuoka-1]GAY16748.1 putative Mce family protein [Mycobacterium sp. shizuoka-1]